MQAAVDVKALGHVAVLMGGLQLRARSFAFKR